MMDNPAEIDWHGAPAACSFAERETDAGSSARPLTKIIATVGPASADPAVLRSLVDAGVSVFRLNFSHGEEADHAGLVRGIRAVEAETQRPLAIMGDLPGPKIRVGAVQQGGVELATGDPVVFQREPIVATAGPAPRRFASRYERLVDDVEPGQRMLINDGAVRLLIVEKDRDSIRCTVTHGGLVTSGKGINLPDTSLSAPAMRDRDWELVRWGIAHEIDWIAMSFVSNADELHALANGIAREAAAQGREGWRLPIVAKIERPLAVENIEPIVAAADAIMVARGDLGVEMDLALVPVIQRQLIRAARDEGKPCIIATQMLESMIERPQPTRAEASDVANAIFEEIDAVMLSGETAVGRFPALAVETMRRIAGHSERYVARTLPPPQPPSKPLRARDPQAALAHGVWSVAEGCGARGIVVWSQSGMSARHISQSNRVPILAFSSDQRVVRQMQMLRGVHPVRKDIPRNLSQFTHAVDELLLRQGQARPGDRVILLAGWPIGPEMVTNTLAIHEIGDPASGYAFHR
jgi:pyruvate kinase